MEFFRKRTIRLQYLTDFYPSKEYSMEILWNLLKYEMKTPSCNSVIVCLSGFDKKIYH